MFSFKFSYQFFGKADGFSFCFIHEAFICIDQQLNGKFFVFFNN